jgi:hypothetical protein
MDWTSIPIVGLLKCGFCKCKRDLWCKNSQFTPVAF